MVDVGSPDMHLLGSIWFYPLRNLVGMPLRAFCELPPALLFMLALDLDISLVHRLAIYQLF